MMSYENKETVRYGQETIKFRTPSLWGKPEFWTQLLYAGIKTLDSGRWTLDAGLWTMDTFVILILLGRIIENYLGEILYGPNDRAYSVKTVF